MHYTHCPNSDLVKSKAFIIRQIHLCKQTTDCTEDIEKHQKTKKEIAVERKMTDYSELGMWWWGIKRWVLSCDLKGSRVEKSLRC